VAEPFYSKGLHFECQKCGYCCRYEPGYVFLSEEELSHLMEKTGLNREEFVSAFCKIADFGIEKRLSLREKENNDCVFWNEQGCSVYEARPLQCRSYPFWPMIVENEKSWEEEKQYCPGLDKGRLHNREEIEEWLEKRVNQTLISR